MRKLSDLSAMRKSNARYIFCIYIRSRLYPKYYTEEIIQKKYELTPDLMTGNQLVDREHKELLEAVNRLMDACSEGKGREKSAEVFRYLLSYVDKHFADEERLQMQAKYPGYAAHKNFHESYKKNLRDIEKTLVAEGPTIAMLSALNRQVGILVTHIRWDDKKMAEYVRAHT